MNRKQFMRRTALVATSIGSMGLLKRIEGAEAGDAPPNVIYVFSDTHRWCSMPFTEAPEIHAPNMTAMKERGITLNRCYSNLPICTPYRSIMQTGRWPFQSGLIENHLDLHNRVDGSNQALGTVFKNAGYRTVYYGKWHLGNTNGKDWGYDVYNSVDAGAGDKAEGGPNKDRRMTANAVAAIDAHAKSESKTPLFLTLSIVDPHGPFTPTKELFQRYASNPNLPFRANDLMKDRTFYNNYYAEISGVDEMLGSVMQALERNGMADNTILIYTSDHGGMGGAQNIGGGQKRMPHEESSHVPFLVRWPGHVPAGKAVDALFSTIDIFPTLCSLAGLPARLKRIGAPAAMTSARYIAECPGVDLSKTLLGQPGGPNPESVFLMHPSNMTNNHGSVQTHRCVVTKDFMYAVKTAYRPIEESAGKAKGKGKAGAKGKKGEGGGKAYGPVQPAGEWCLYDLKKDPLEMKNLVNDPAYTAIKAEMRAKLKAWIAKAETPYVDRCFNKMNETVLAKWNTEHGVAKADRAKAIAVYQEDLKGAI